MQGVTDIYLQKRDGPLTRTLFFQRRLKTGQPQRERLPFGKIDCVWRIKNGPLGSGRSFAVG